MDQDFGVNSQNFNYFKIIYLYIYIAVVLRKIIDLYFKSHDSFNESCNLLDGLVN